MKKVAIFVEGMTEQKFVVMFLTEWFNSLGIHVELAKQLHGKVALKAAPLHAENISAYVLVVDCASDEQVMTQIRDQYASLQKANYTAIIGLRDVFPKTHAEIGLLRRGLQSSMPNGTLKTEIHLAEMEVEAWFLAEGTHFARVNSSLTPTRIRQGGFDITQPCENWANPAKTLHQIYKLEGLAYKKSAKQVKRTLDALSRTELAIHVIPSVRSLGEFVDALGAAVT